MKVRIEIDDKILRSIINEYLIRQLGDLPIDTDNYLKIEVKSKQNYKSEWEKADFRVVYEKST
jgi:hypothetical protein